MLAIFISPVLSLSLTYLLDHPVVEAHDFTGSWRIAGQVGVNFYSEGSGANSRDIGFALVGRTTNPQGRRDDY